ncbi:endonuclease [Candidatus Falkowbacteria bacterium CG10_big_fil_rev_8_21_14_0_10_43_10]|uniref:UPF0102 protein COT99_02185 n=1 Tax=Candidatus Falkowbacteria bacterium CG10_big_fil_rev_8_21_14_0_10_43_10 TaxID=1974567 RepID=A0A2H0V295_9BACT|nr:MAG: endonuclease [Candidatus Falkowbacteria bacterium CG10_big_fil_rev_8_21_14_0_10_43_10]
MEGQYFVLKIIFMHNQEIGRYGEQLACEYLIRKGYKILSRNYKASYKELDIVAERGVFIVFAEVKTRISKYYGSGIESMSQKKQRDLKYAINKYLTLKKLWNKEPRGDLILVDINKGKKIAKIKHYEDIL